MAESTEDAIIILTAVRDSTEAAFLARKLVEDRLAACVSQIPGVKSLFRWEGRLDTAEETLLLVKTTVLQASKAMAKIQELHSYAVPEILALPVTGQGGPYMDWLRSELEPEAERDDAT